MAKPTPPPLALCENPLACHLSYSRPFSFKMSFPRLPDWGAGVKPPDKNDLTTTPYGRRFLQLAQQIFSGARPGVRDVPDILRKYRSGPGQVFIPVSHRAHWLDDEEREIIGPLIDAIDLIYKRRDKKPLLALLRSQPDQRFAHLADLLENFELKKPAHRPKTPAYDRTNNTSRLLLAKEFVGNLRKSGMPLKDALAMAAKENSVEESTLADFHAKRHRASKKP